MAWKNEIEATKRQEKSMRLLSARSNLQFGRKHNKVRIANPHQRVYKISKI